MLSTIVFAYTPENKDKQRKEAIKLAKKCKCGYVMDCPIEELFIFTESDTSVEYELFDRLAYQYTTLGTYWLKRYFFSSCRWVSGKIVNFLIWFRKSW